MLSKLMPIKEIALDLLWALRWLVLYKAGYATWRDLKSFRYRHRLGSDTAHRRDRVVDDVLAVKLSKLIGRAALRSAMREDLLLTNRELGSSVVQGVSFVIPFGDPKGDRLRLLQLCLRKIAELFPSAEVIVSDLVGTLREPGIRESLPAEVRIIFGNCDPEDFNIALAVNRGVLASRHEISCILQADILIPSGLTRVVNEFMEEDIDYWFPACGVFFLNEESTIRLFHGNNASLCPASYCRELESYCLLIKRAAFEKIGGYYPEFTQNYEDIDFYDRLLDLRTAGARPLAFYHCWHPLYHQMSRAKDRNKRLLAQRRDLPLQQRISEAREMLKRTAIEILAMKGVDFTWRELIKGYSK